MLLSYMHYVSACTFSKSLPQACRSTAQRVLMAQPDAQHCAVCIFHPALHKLFIACLGVHQQQARSMVCSSVVVVV
jgi:hypothetical protein